MSIATTWGTTADERRRGYACDRLIAGAQDSYYRGVDVRAPAAVVFRWLCQLRVAPYSYDWIDNVGRRSPQTLTSGVDALAVGQHVMRIFHLVAFEQDRHLTLVLREARGTALFGRTAVSYTVAPVSDSTSRLLVKIVVQHPRPPWGWLTRALLPWGDFLMMRRQLLNLRDLAERTTLRR